MNESPAPSDEDLRVAASAIGQLLRDRGQVLATAESCTGGWIGKLVTDVPGSSAWFEGGAVTYSNRLKHALLGVGPDTLGTHGAVSGETAIEMVAGTLARFGAGVAVAVTGIAGPDGDAPGKPVGTVWIAWQRHGGKARAEEFHFAGDRDAVRRQAVAAALNGVRSLFPPWPTSPGIGKA